MWWSEQAQPTNHPNSAASHLYSLQLDVGKCCRKLMFTMCSSLRSSGLSTPINNASHFEKHNENIMPTEHAQIKASKSTNLNSAEVCKRAPSRIMNYILESANTWVWNGQEFKHKRKRTWKDTCLLTHLLPTYLITPQAKTQPEALLAFIMFIQVS